MTLSEADEISPLLRFIESPEPDVSGRSRLALSTENEDLIPASRRCRGVISCVQLINARIQGREAIPEGKVPRGFGPNDMTAVKSAAEGARALIDGSLFQAATGWNLS